MSKPCPCRWCEENRRIEAVIESGDPMWLAGTVADLWNRLAMADEEACYLHALLDGSWPSAREAALRIIATVDANEQQSRAGGEG